jgi:hypothetical protein
MGCCSSRSDDVRFPGSQSEIETAKSCVDDVDPAIEQDTVNQEDEAASTTSSNARPLAVDIFYSTTQTHAGCHLVVRGEARGEFSCPAELGELNKIDAGSTGQAQLPDAPSRLNPRYESVESLPASLHDLVTRIDKSPQPIPVTINHNDRESCSRPSQGRTSAKDGPRFSARVSPMPIEANLRTSSSTSKPRNSLKDLSDRLKAERQNQSKRQLLSGGSHRSMARTLQTQASTPFDARAAESSGMRRLFSESLDSAGLTESSPSSVIDRMLAGLSMAGGKKSQPGLSRSQGRMGENGPSWHEPSLRSRLEGASSLNSALPLPGPSPSSHGYHIESAAHQSILRSMIFALSLVPPIKDTDHKHSSRH